MRRTLIIALAALALLPGAPAAAARTETERYIGPGVLTLGQSRSYCPADFGSDENIGEVCFYVDGETQVTLTIDDDTSPRVQGYYTAWAGREIVANAFFCDAVTVALPEGTTSIDVSVGEAFNVSCAIWTTAPHAATTGIVTAAFS